MEENAIIRLQDVSVSFDRRVVLRDIDFTIDKGDFVAITGPNGGGKTTLLRVNPLPGKWCISMRANRQSVCT